MFEFLFDCAAFEISTTTQLLNNILFPVVLFVLIFWLMCEIFLIDFAVDGSLLSMSENLTDGIVTTQIDEDISKLENLVVNIPVTSDENRNKTELFDIDRERKYLKALGVRKLRDFCKNRKIKGYAIPCKQRGIDGLVEFLLQRQIYACNIEQSVKHVEISA
jgi:hypothetical protein